MDEPWLPNGSELWFNAGMLKAQAIELLGGTVAAAADAVGVTYQAVDKWPDELPPRIADRVQAALWRMQHKGATGPSPSAQPPAEQEAAHG